MTKYPLSNLIQRPEDKRDLLLSVPLGVVQNLPQSVDLRKYSGTVEDQKNTNSCVANSTVSILEILLTKANKFTDLSRLFVYWNARVNYESLRGIDGGAYLIDGLKSCYKYGVPPESTWAFDTGAVNTEPTTDVYAIAKNTKVEKYTRVGSFSGADRSEAISLAKAALAMGYPLVIGMQIHADIFSMHGALNSATCKYNTVVKTPSEYAGGHAMCVVGYNESGFIIENSWGARWGDNGYCIIGYDALNQACFEALTCTKFAGIEFEPEWSFTDKPEPMSVKLNTFPDTFYVNPKQPNSIMFPWINADVVNGTMPYTSTWECSDSRVSLYVTGKSAIGSIDTKTMAPNEAITIKFTCSLVDSSIPENQVCVADTIIRVMNAVKPVVIKPIDSTYGKAYRLYRVAFNRIPDDAGLAYWEAELDRGMTLETVAAHFIASGEFQQKYGNAVTNKEFMTLLYKNGLRREPDLGGLNWWVNQLDTGVKNKPDVLVGFSESVENRTMTVWF